MKNNQLAAMSLMTAAGALVGYYLPGGLNLKILNFTGWAVAEFVAVIAWLAAYKGD